MIITICGSTAFAQKMIVIARELEQAGHTVFLPYTVELEKVGKQGHHEAEQGKGTAFQVDYIIKHDLIRKHYKKIKQSDAILVVNEEKNNIKGYVGGNTLMEIGFAYILSIKIYMLNQPPRDISYTDEILAMQPTVINDDLSKII